MPIRYLSQNGPVPIAPNLAASALVVTEGDSLTQNLAAGSISYPTIFTARNPNGLLTLSNTATAGSRLSSMIVREPTDLALIASNPGKTDYILTFFAIANEITNVAYYPSNAAGLVADTGAYADTMRAGGFEFLVGATMTSSGGVNETPELANWTRTVNNGMRALVGTKFDAIMDFGGQLGGLWGASTNRLLFTDGLHFTYNEQLACQLEFASVVNGISNRALPPGPPSGIAFIQTLQTQFTLLWEPGQTGGLYTDFELQYRSGVGAWTTWSHQAGSRQIVATVSGLTPNTSYQFRLRFVGLAGSSGWVYATATTEATVAGTIDVNRSTTSIVYPYNLVVLSSADTVASRNTAVTAVATAFGSTGHSSGKYYFEFQRQSTTTLESYGLADSSVGGFPRLGTAPNSAMSGASSAASGFTIVNVPNVSFVGVNGMIAVDFGAKKAWFGSNNSWANSGNPVTGANPWITWSADYELYPAFDLTFAGTGAKYIGSGFAYTPPSGFSAWG